MPHHIVEYTKILEDKGATKIIILTDLDTDQCVTNTKERILPLQQHTVVVSVKQIESWFLSDTFAIRNFLNDQTLTIENPESFNDPFIEIKRLRIASIGRGVADKKILARLMIKSGFSIQSAASHNNCDSAKYFLQAIQREATETD